MGKGFFLTLTYDTTILDLKTDQVLKVHNKVGPSFQKEFDFQVILFF